MEGYTNESISGTGSDGRPSQRNVPDRYTTSPGGGVRVRISQMAEATRGAIPPQGTTTHGTPSIRTQDKILPRTTAPQCEPGTDLQGVLRQLADAIGNADGGSDIPGTSVRTPEKFTGRERSKFRTFIAQVKLVFRANPRKFAEDTTKVTYACSYLSDAAFSWYENFVTATLEPSWFHDFALFEHALEEQFGSINAEATAERKIHQLKMRTGDSISNYITHFTSLKNNVEWNDAALSFAFKRGLPARIKDDIARNDFRPTTFQEVMDLAIRVDFQWHDREIERSSDTRDHTRESSTTSTVPSRRSMSSTQPSNSSRVLVTTTKLPLDDKGKILEKERERRIHMKLCHYCGGDHFLDKCEKRPPHNSTNTKVMIAQASLPPQKAAFATRTKTPEVPSGNNWEARGKESSVNITTDNFIELATQRNEPPCIQLNVKFPGCNTIFGAMVDCGSTHSHLSERIASLAGVELLDNPWIVDLVGLEGKVVGKSKHSAEWDFVIKHHRFASKTNLWLISKIEGRHEIILGLDFLRNYNPMIDWAVGEVFFKSAGRPDWTYTIFPVQDDLPLPSEEIAQEAKPAEVPITDMEPFQYMTPDLTTTSDTILQALNTTYRPGDIEVGPPTWEGEPLEDITDQLPDFRSLGIGEDDYSQPLDLQTQVFTLSTMWQTWDAIASSEPRQDGQEPNIRDIEDISGMPWEYAHHWAIFAPKPAAIYPNNPGPPSRTDHDYSLTLVPGLASRTQEQPKSGTYWQNETELAEIKRYFNQLELDGLIEIDSSRGSTSPAFAVTLPNGFIKVYVDYRRLNYHIQEVPDYDMPYIATSIRKARSGTIFTKLSVKDAFQQLRIKEEDEHHTRFKTPDGTNYRWKVMPFGLKNNVAYWQRFMNYLLPAEIHQDVLVYIDDILIFSNNLVAHKRAVVRVMDVLAAAGIRLNIQICQFNTEITNLGGITITHLGQ